MLLSTDRDGRILSYRAKRTDGASSGSPSGAPLWKILRDNGEGGWRPFSVNHGGSGRSAMRQEVTRCIS